MGKFTVEEINLMCVFNTKNGKFRLCPDTGGACYDCFATFQKGMSIDILW